MQKLYGLWIALLAMAGASIALRLLSHIPNVAPIAALALFAGTYATGRWAWLVPLAALFASDLVIGFYDAGVMATVYASFAAISVIGWWVRRNAGAPRIFLGTLAGSVLFFLTTNFATWVFTDLYPKTFEGLAACFVAAIPFFRYTVVGDLFYVAAFFGAWALARSWAAGRAARLMALVSARQ